MTEETVTRPGFILMPVDVSLPVTCNSCGASARPGAEDWLVLQRQPPVIDAMDDALCPGCIKRAMGRESL